MWHVSIDPLRIKITSGTTFLCHDVPCQLLGVVESSDPAIRAKAFAFTKKWFASVGNGIMIDNDDSMIQERDGTNLVWVRGYDSTLSCLNLKLVAAGLVQVDYSRHKDYTFEVYTQTGQATEDWQQELENARLGETLRVLLKNEHPDK